MKLYQQCSVSKNISIFKIYAKLNQNFLASTFLDWFVAIIFFMSVSSFCDMRNKK